MKVATKAPAIPSAVVRMKPLGSFGPGESTRAIRPAMKPMMIIQMMFHTTISHDYESTIDLGSDFGGLKLGRVECVAAVDLPRLQPGHEPARALLRGAVGESVGHHIALSLPLQPVVADGRCGLHRRLHVARFDEVPRFLRVVRPHAGKAVGL